MVLEGAMSISRGSLVLSVSTLMLLIGKFSTTVPRGRVERCANIMFRARANVLTGSLMVCCHWGAFFVLKPANLPV